MRINIFFISLLFIIIAPGAYYIYIEKISYSSGSLISAFFVLLVYLTKYKKIDLDRSCISVFIVSIGIFVVSLSSMILFDWFDYNRFYLSYILILISTLGSIVFFELSMKIKDKSLCNSISAVFYIVLADGLIYLIYKIIFPLSKYPFLIFFPEMSHFSLIFLPLLLFKVLTSKNNTYVYTIILFSLILAFIVENLTLLVGIIMVMMIYSIRRTLILFFIPVIFYLLFFGTDNFIYFTNRLVGLAAGLTLEGKDNISALVFLSGWERAYLNLVDYGLFGIGFNQLGYEGQIGYFQDKIRFHGLYGLNLKDGGSLAPKIISELGIFGIILIFMYLFYFIKITYKIKRYNFSYSYLDIFYISIFIMSFINFFVRGSGYFSPIMFLFYSSIIYFLRRGISKNIN